MSRSNWGPGMPASWQDGRAPPRAGGLQAPVTRSRALRDATSLRRGQPGTVGFRLGPSRCMRTRGRTGQETLPEQTEDAAAAWPGVSHPLGATHDGVGTNFAVFSEVADQVELCLFDDQGAETRVGLREV